MKTLRIDKIQGFFLVLAGIILLSAMCFAVVYANFVLTDKVASAEELPIDPLEPSELHNGIHVGDTGRWIVFPSQSISFDTYFGWTDMATFRDTSGNTFVLQVENSSSLISIRISSSVYANSIVYSYNKIVGLINTVIYYCPTSTITCVLENGFQNPIGNFLRSILHTTISLYDSLPDVYENMGYNDLVPDYNALVDRYNQLEGQYNDLLEDYSYVNIVNNIGSSVTSTNFSDYRSSRVVSGLFLNDIPVYYSENTSSSTYGDILAMPLGGTYLAGTKFRFNYYMIGMSNQNTVAINGGVHVGYIADGVLNAIFTTDDTNCWAYGRSNFEIEFTLPVDTNVLYFYCENSSTKAHIYLSDVNVSVLSSNIDILVEQAFQRGVDSVNTQYYINQGYEAGYYAGLSEDNPYTFRSLMGAVVDAPLDVFTQMFDFDILGVNMKTLYLSLFTLGVVLIVLKFALGRL